MGPYNYSFNNPIVCNDPSGADPDGGNNLTIAPTIDNTYVAPSAYLPDEETKIDWIKSAQTGDIYTQLPEVVIHSSVEIIDRLI